MYSTKKFNFDEERNTAFRTKMNDSISKIIAEKERLATSINPELISILLEHKVDLLFNRQLRINAHIPQYKSTLIKADEIIGKDFINLWLKDTKLNMTKRQAEGLFELALENFFLQINQENLHKAWLEAYFDQLKRLTSTFANPLDGSVYTDENPDGNFAKT